MTHRLTDEQVAWHVKYYAADAARHALAVEVQEWRAASPYDPTTTSRLLSAQREQLDAAENEIRELKAEIARHHKDFERWEAMADKGAQQVAKLAAIDNLHQKVSYPEAYGGPLECCSYCGRYWACETHKIIHSKA